LKGVDGNPALFETPDVDDLNVLDTSDDGQIGDSSESQESFDLNVGSSIASVLMHPTPQSELQPPSNPPELHNSTPVFEYIPWTDPDSLDMVQDTPTNDQPLAVLSSPQYNPANGGGVLQQVANGSEYFSQDIFSQNLTMRPEEFSTSAIHDPIALGYRYPTVTSGLYEYCCLNMGCREVSSSQEQLQQHCYKVHFTFAPIDPALRLLCQGCGTYHSQYSLCCQHCLDPRELVVWIYGTKQNLTLQPFSHGVPSGYSSGQMSRYFGSNGFYGMGGVGVSSAYGNHSKGPRSLNGGYYGTGYCRSNFKSQNADIHEPKQPIWHTLKSDHRSCIASLYKTLGIGRHSTPTNSSHYSFHATSLLHHGPYILFMLLTIALTMDDTTVPEPKLSPSFAGLFCAHYGIICVSAASMSFVICRGAARLRKWLECQPEVWSFKQNPPIT
jgi:hypothetical protein